MHMGSIKITYAPIDTKKGKRQYYLSYSLVFAIAAMIVYCWYFAAGRTFIWNGDGWVQHFKALVYYARYLRAIILELVSSHRLVIPEWDFCIGEGSDILQTFHYYVIGDPFAFFSVLAPVRFLHLYYDGMILLRLYLAGVMFSVLCFESGCRSRYGVLAGSLSYVFCFWAVFNTARHPFFLNPMVYLPMLLIGVERIFRGRRLYFMIAAVFLSAVSNLYFFYMLVMVTVIYTALRLAVFYRKTPALRKVGLRLFLRIVFASVVGVGLAAVILLPSCYMVLHDARFSSSPALHLFYPFYYYCRLPSALFSQGNEYWTCMGYAAPVFPAVALLFCRKRYGFLKALFLSGILMFLFPVFGWAMNGFSYTTNRWSWAFALLCAYILAVAWPLLMTAGIKDSRAMAVCLMVCFAVCILLEPSRTVMNFSALCLILLVVVLPWLFCEETGIWRKSNRQRMALILVLVSIGVNSFWLNAPEGGNYAAEAWESAYVFDGLLHNETAAVRNAAAADQADGFYRYTGRNLSLNAGILSGPSSTQYYWSLSNPCVSKFRSEMGLCREDEPLNYYGYDDRAALAALAAVHYYVVPDWDASPVPYGYTLVDMDEGAGAGYMVYRNDYALPLAYTYDSQISEQTWNSLSTIEKQEALLQGVVLEDYGGEVQETELFLQDRKINVKIQCSGESIELLDHAIAVMAPEASVTFSFEGAADSETYFQIDGLEYQGVPDYDIGDENVCIFERLKKRIFWKQPDGTKLIFTASDGRQKILNYYTQENSKYNGQHNFAVNLGYTQEGISSVTVVFAGTGIYSFDSLQISCLPMGRYVQTLQQRQEDVLQQTVIGTNTVTGEISLDKPKLMCLAVPYSPGWRAFVDGKESRLYRANEMYMALELQAGEHNIELVYHTPWRKEGVCISLFALLLFIIYLLFGKKAVFIQNAAGKTTEMKISGVFR